MPNTPNATSHTNCAHASTKAARAKCRRERGQLETEVVDIREEIAHGDPFDLLPDPDGDSYWDVAYAEDARNWSHML